MAHYFCNWQCWDIELQQGKAHFSNFVRKWKKQEAAPKRKWIPLNVNRLIQNNLLSFIFHLCCLFLSHVAVCVCLYVLICAGAGLDSQRWIHAHGEHNECRVPIWGGTTSERAWTISACHRGTHMYTFSLIGSAGGSFVRLRYAVIWRLILNINPCLHHYLQLGNYFGLISNRTFI